jgi:SAM-dependent methyltransferase
VYPLSRTSIEPVTKRASSEQRYRTAATSSSGLPIRPAGNIDVSLLGRDALAVQEAPDHVARDVDRGEGQGIHADARKLGANRPNVDIHAGEVLPMRYRQEFDLVVSFNALHWVHDLDSAFQR